MNTVRAFEDGDYVVLHTDYNFYGPKVGFDIFRFEDGKIVEQGTHQQLINAKGHYYRLYTRQYEDEATNSILK